MKCLALATAHEQSAPAVICPGDPGRQQEERRREDRVHHQQQDAQSALSAGTPAVAGKALLKIKDGTPDDKDLLIWKWLKGAATTQMEFGNPLAADDYTLCMYDNGALVTSATAPSGGTCPTCWTNDGNGFSYKNALRTPEGVQSSSCWPAVPATRASCSRARASTCACPTSTRSPARSTCSSSRRRAVSDEGATYSPPFLKGDGVSFKDKAD